MAMTEVRENDFANRVRDAKQEVRQLCDLVQRLAEDLTGSVPDEPDSVGSMAKQDLGVFGDVRGDAESIISLVERAKSAVGRIKRGMPAREDDGFNKMQGGINLGGPASYGKIGG